jgi:hypothetical protein
MYRNAKITKYKTGFETFNPNMLLNKIAKAIEPIVPPAKIQGLK